MEVTQEEIDIIKHGDVDETDKVCQQAFTQGRKSRDLEVTELRQQLAERETQVTLLRDKVDWLRRYGCKDDLAFRVAQDALLATEADLTGLVLCYAEPLGHVYQHDETGRTMWLAMPDRMNESRWHEIPLYRAKEQGK
jgi:hypothetical protein